MKTRLWAVLAVLALICAGIAIYPDSASAGPGKGSPASAGAGGSTELQIIGKDGKPAGFVPLRHTDIKTEISGFVARISLTQEFENVLPNAIEAIYVFPLPHDSAVDGMTMVVGDREIKAVIKEREEARRVYEAARNSGHTAALLDQERPNIFTQSVANIPPNSKVEVTLSVIELLKYEAGTYEFAFPLVVGPRYIPGSPAGAANKDGNPPEVQDVALKTGGDDQRGTMADTDKVPDASKISPPVAGVHTGDPHAGHDVSIAVNLTAGMYVTDVDSTSHKISSERTGPDSFHVQLADDAALPNKDFILKYKVAGAGIGDAVLTHADQSGGYFTLILQPPEKVPDDAVVPRELIFVLDTSGSMWGFPLEMAKKTIARALDHLRPEETFNLITFSGDTRILFPEAVPATPENIKAARTVLAGAYGGGGTEMMKAIRTALGDDAAAGKPVTGPTPPLRVVCFMTDGYVGDDAEIVAAVQKHPEARVFAFGIGTAVNRFLLTKMAEEGHGEVEFVTRPEEAQTAADRFYERVHSPVLTNISLDWSGLPVADVYPAQVPDLFSAKPIIVTGRYTQAAKGTLVIHGTRAGGAFTREVAVDFPAENSSHAALEKIWARNKVENLMSQDWIGIQHGQSKYKAQIIDVGLKHSLATQYTSFVAVETKTVVQDGKPVRIEVPVELPENVSPLAVPGAENDKFVENFWQRRAATSGASGLAGSFGVPASVASLQPGTSAASTTVEVTANAPMVETDTAQVTTTFSGTELHGPQGTPGRTSNSPKADKEKGRNDLLASKLSADLLTLYQCSQKRNASAAGKACSLPASGKVNVEVTLDAASAGAEQKLTTAGLTIKSGTGTAVVTGEIEITKLKALAEITEVKTVTKLEQEARQIRRRG
ncbi:MAG TPA: VIT domain-containing protein [Candidatus Angelobacter sp.]